jgi:YD repeat-containing protein
MKATARCLTVSAVILLATAFAHAQCSTGWCMTAFSVSENTLLGDTSDFSTATATIYVPPSNNPPQSVPLYLSENQFGSTKSVCVGGSIFSMGCVFPVSVGNNTVQFEFNGYNMGTTAQNGSLTATSNDYPHWDFSVPITVLPAGSFQETPTQDPDAGGSCPDCAGQGGRPINFANGNTWIPQQDYSIPGLGGGLSLTRTWNSLWSLMQPVEQSGIFGDSWRSNFEARIQVLSGGVVKYWKGDGGVLTYTYNSMSGFYVMTAPTDDQTTLTYNLSLAQWTISEKNGTQRIFNGSGYLIGIIDRNGNTTNITVDANNQNRIASVTDPASRTLTFYYTNASFPRLCTSVADASGTVANYTYDASGRLTQVAYADGSQLNFTYDSNNLILKVTDSQSKTIEAHTYDSQRRGLTSQQGNDSSGRAVNKVTVTYSPYWNPSTNQVCDSLGDSCASLSFTNRGQRHYMMSASGIPCSTCGFYNNESSGFSSVGFKTIHTDSNGHTTVYSYDSQGNITSKVLPDQNGGDTWNYTYNGFGEVLTVTDPLGHVTTNQYDSNGNLLSATTPSPDGVLPGSTTTFTYDAHGELLTMTDPR